MRGDDDPSAETILRVGRSSAPGSIARSIASLDGSTVVRVVPVSPRLVE